MMYVVCVTVWVKEGFGDAFAEATLENRVGARQEPGNVRFDLLRNNEDENQFFIYEVYRDEAAFKEHQLTAHYFKWRETVADWMAQKRQGVKYSSIAPVEIPEW